MDSQYATYLAGIPDGQSKTDGIAVGESSAAVVLTARAGDNFGSNLPYVQPPVARVGEPTLSTPPVDYNLQFVIPITSDSPASFRPGPPLALTSRTYAMNVAEVQALGRSDSTVRTAEQLDVAKFWSESAFTLWTRGVRNLAIARGLGELETARLMAMTTLAAADALISCWEAKYHYSFAWRPVHAITRADTDGNLRTIKDPTWTSLLNQNHPEYPAGHGCYGSSVVTALQKYFGTDEIAISLDSTAAGLTSPTHSYQHLSDIVEETNNARVWAGVHFRHTMKVSKKLGKTVARHALHHQFRPLHEPDDHDDCDHGDRRDGDGEGDGPSRRNRRAQPAAYWRLNSTMPLKRNAPGTGAIGGGCSGGSAISRSYSATSTRSRLASNSSSRARAICSAARGPTIPEKNSLAQPLP
jgi:hypothetical protein